MNYIFNSIIKWCSSQTFAIDSFLSILLYPACWTLFLCCLLVVNLVIIASKEIKVLFTSKNNKFFLSEALLKMTANLLKRSILTGGDM